MRVAICYPPLPSAKGVPLLSQNRQFQWFSRPTYIFPVVPATAATMLKEAGHEVAWLDGIAEEWTPERFRAELDSFGPDLVVLETKTPVVKRHWKWIADYKASAPDVKMVLVGDHVTALPDESMSSCPVDYILTGGDWDFLLRNIVEVGFGLGLSSQEHHRGRLRPRQVRARHLAPGRQHGPVQAGP